MTITQLRAEHIERRYADELAKKCNQALYNAITDEINALSDAQLIEEVVRAGGFDEPLGDDDALNMLTEVYEDLMIEDTAATPTNAHLRQLALNVLRASRAL